MTRAFPLQSLLDLSQLRLDEAGRKLGELIAAKLGSKVTGTKLEYGELTVAANAAARSPR